MKEMTINELAQLREKEDIIILDVRDREDFAPRHFEGSHNLPWPELEAGWQGLDPRETYHIVCTKGIRAQKASDFLSSKGYQVVRISDGWGNYRE